MALNKPTGDMLNAGSDVAAQDLGTAAAGTSSSYSRADHVHKKPTAAEVGAVATSQLAALNGVATLDGAGKLTTAQIPALTTAQIAQITPAAIGAMATSERASLATLTSGTLTTSQVAALTGDVTSTAGSPATTVVKIQSKAVSNATPGAGQVLTWDGSQWAPATSTGGGGGGANGLTYYLNYATAPDAPITGLPATVKQLGRQGEVLQQSITTAALAVNTWTYIAGFVSESAPIDPATTQIPAGLWDFNIWAFGDANVAANTSIRAVAYVYNGTGLTLLGTSGGQVINGSSAQYSLSVLVPQTTVALTDRIYIAIEAYATGNNHTVTAQFGDSTPSHVHTSLGLVGGTGLWKNVAGVLQSPATLLFDADVDASAAIANSKIAGLAASATTDTTNASNITSGTLSTSQLATISGLPTGAQGTTTVIPSITVDSKGRVTALSTNTMASYVQTSALNAANGVATLDGNAKLTVGQMPGLTGDITSTAGTAATTLATITTAQTSVGNSTTVPVVSIDAKGRVTALSTATISGGSGTVTTSGTSLTGSLSKFSSETAITKAVAGTDYQAPLSSAAPLAISAGGTGANNATDGLANLGNSIFPVTVRQVGNITPVTPTATTMTFAVGVGIAGTTVIDGYTIAQGDSVCFVLQSVTNQSGPWVITTLGTASVGAVLTRPSWFTTGTAKSGTLCVIQAGTSNTGFILALSGPLNGTNAPIAIGTATITVSTIWGRSTLATVSANTFTSTQTLMAGTAAVVPLKFNTGSVLTTTPVANGIDWDSYQLYQTGSNGVRRSFRDDLWTTVSASPSGTVILETETQDVLYYSSATTANWVINIRGWTSSATFAGTWVAGSPNITLTTGTTTSLVVGMLVASGPSTTATILSIGSATTFTMSANAATSGSGALSFIAKLSNVLAIGQARTAVFVATQGATPYTPTIQIDGTTTGVTTKWANGSNAVNASALDMISMSVIRTGTSTYTVFAGITKFA